MFKKSLLSAAVLGCIALSAHAQLNSAIKPPAMQQAPDAATMSAPTQGMAAAQQNPASPAPVAVVQTVAPAMPAPATDAKPVVNPFTGKPLTLEASQRALEQAHLDTQLLEERIRQASLNEDLRTLPLKKQVEEAQAVTARMKEEAVQKEVLHPAATLPTKQATVVAAADATDPVPHRPARPAKKVKKVTAPVEPAVKTAPPVTPPAPVIEVTSVMSLGGDRSAVMDIDGNILTVKQGETTPFGAVDIVDGQTVHLGARVLHVHGATLARVVISDPKIIDVTKQPTAPVANGPTVTSTTMPPAAIIPTSKPAGLQVPQLPPLQLPQGVTIIPAAQH